MRKRFLLLFTIVFLSFTPAATTFAEDSQDTVLITGDSHALGPAGKELATILRKKGFKVVIDAKVSSTVSRVVELNLCEKRRYDMVFAFLGSNETSTYRLDSLYSKLSHTCPNLFIIGAPFFSKKELSERVDDVYKTQFEVFGTCKVIDSRELTKDITGRTRDGVHFTPSGGKLWAARVYHRVFEDSCSR